MKFYKTDAFKISTTAVMTFLLTTTILKSIYTPAFAFIVSDRISLNDAINYSGQYITDSRRLEVAVADPKGHMHRTTLRGMRFDARQIDEVINHNRNPVIRPDGTKDSTADEVLIYFGKNGTTSTGISSVANIHVIAVGAKNGNLMLNRSSPADVNASSLFDKTKPCPGSPGCPTGF